VESDDETIRAMLDKDRTYELARQVGIETPRTATIRAGVDIAGAVDGITCPLALKPIFSHLFAEGFGSENKLLVASNTAELDAAAERLLELGIDVMATEIIPGSDELLWSYCGYIDEHGEVLDEFIFRKIRQWPNRFGLGCYVVSDWDDEVAEVALRFLRGIGLKGLFHVELKRDPRDGRLKLIECNHRFTIELIYSQTNLPLLAYNRLLGRPLPPRGKRKTGVHLWNPAKDVRSFRSHRRRGKLSLFGWLWSLVHRQRFHVFRWDDPMPTVHFNGHALGRKARRLFRRRPSASGEREDDDLRTLLP
jgi:predicted ATP-grasp superfamily ATP-dependent carboligase